MTLNKLIWILFTLFLVNCSNKKSDISVTSDKFTRKFPNLTFISDFDPTSKQEKNADKNVLLLKQYDSTLILDTLVKHLDCNFSSLATLKKWVENKELSKNEFELLKSFWEKSAVVIDTSAFLTPMDHYHVYNSDFIPFVISIDGWYKLEMDELVNQFRIRYGIKIEFDDVNIDPNKILNYLSNVGSFGLSPDYYKDSSHLIINESWFYEIFNQRKN